MLTKRMAGGAALVLSMSAAIRIARGQMNGSPPDVPRAGAAGLASAGSGEARAAYLAGKRAVDGQRRPHFAAGVAAARVRLAERPDDPEGLLWLAANLGAEALERGKLSALKVLPEMERLLLALEARAPGYDHAAAARTLARLYHKAPAFISIGSMKKARQYWERALERAGDYPPNLVLAADFFADDGERQRAAGLAARYLERPIAESDNPEAAEWRQIAERLAGRGRR
jgi:hypothetical protein